MKQNVLKHLGDNNWMLSLNRFLYILQGQMPKLKVAKCFEHEGPVRYVKLENGLVGITDDSEKLLKFYEINTLLNGGAPKY